jgi:hypothetical protein
MDPSPVAPARQSWPSLWFTAIVSLLAQLGLCQFFTFGQSVPFSIDVNPSNLWKYADHFPPRGEFLTLNWFGIANLPPTLNPFSLAAAHLPVWLFFTAYAPVLATAALLAMALFLRELRVPRPAALVGAVIYAWQGDMLPFVFPGHYGYISTWPFFALAAWAALRASRHWAHALIAGASCGMMIGLQPDRGSIASLLIGALYLAPLLRRQPWLNEDGQGDLPGHATAQTRASGRASIQETVGQLALCAGTALLVSLAAFLALFQSNIVGVKLGGASDREQLFSLATQYSLSPVETLTYIAPGVFGWHSSSTSGPYWGWIGQTPGYSVSHRGTRNLNLGISTIGTTGTLLALLGAALLFPGQQRFFGWQGIGAPRPEEPQNPQGPWRAPQFPAAKPERLRENETAIASRPPAPALPQLPPPTFSDRQLFYGRLFFILGFLTLLLSWGYHTPLYRPLFALPLMDKWRNPLKWLEIFNFAAIVLSAFGVTQLLRSLVDVTQRHALALIFAVVVGLLFVLVLANYPFAIAVAGFLTSEDYAPIQIASVMHTLHVSLGVAFLAGLALCLLVFSGWYADLLQRWEIINPWLRRQWQRALSAENRAGSFAVGCAALASLQLGWVATQFIVPTDLTNLTASNPLLDSLRAEGPLVRVAVPQPQDSLLNFYLQNQFAEFRISSIDISAASRIPDDLATFVDAFSGQTARLWLLGGVKNVAIGQAALSTLRQEPDVAANISGADGYTLAAMDNDLPTHALVRLRDYFPKALFIPAEETITNPDELVARLADPKWNPRATLLLADPVPGMPSGEQGPRTPLALAPPPDINVTHYTPHQIDLHLNSPRSGYVLINDRFDADWQVTLNDQPAPLLRADYLLRAIAVPPGPSHIELRYSAHYRLGRLAIPAIFANDFSDAVMLGAFALGTFFATRPRR